MSHKCHTLPPGTDRPDGVTDAGNCDIIAQPTRHDTEAGTFRHTAAHSAVSPSEALSPAPVRYWPRSWRCRASVSVGRKGYEAGPERAGQIGLDFFR